MNLWPLLDRSAPVVTTGWAAILCLAWSVPGILAADGPGSPKPLDVQVVGDIPYREVYVGEDAKKEKNKLDLYLPRGQKGFPLLFFVHGGAWMHGDKNFFGLYSNLGMYWARHGIGTVVINYRLSPAVKHPEHIKDVARAFAWTYRNIQQYGGRPDQIFVCGHSAGGHLVALLATDETYLRAEGLSAQTVKGVIPISGVFRVHDVHLNAGVGAQGAGGAAGGSVQVRAAPFGSVFGIDPAVRRNASPLSHVRPGLPPFLVVYADHDLPTLPDMAREFDAALRDRKCAVQTLEVKHRNHITVLLNAARDEDPVTRAITEFIATHTAKERAPGSD